MTIGIVSKKSLALIVVMAIMTIGCGADGPTAPPKVCGPQSRTVSYVRDGKVMNGSSLGVTPIFSLRVNSAGNPSNLAAVKLDDMNWQISISVPTNDTEGNEHQISVSDPARTGEWITADGISVAGATSVRKDGTSLYFRIGCGA